MKLTICNYCRWWRLSGFDKCAVRIVADRAAMQIHEGALSQFGDFPSSKQGGDEKRWLMAASLVRPFTGIGTGAGAVAGETALRTRPTRRSGEAISWRL